MENKQKIVFGILGMLVVLAVVPSVSAEFWACFSEGQEIDFCNPNIDDRTCGKTLCKYCMSNFDEGNGCYSPGNFNACNNAGGECAIGEGGLDLTPPEFIVNNPIQDSIHTERRVSIDFLLDEVADVSFTDLLDGRGRWTRICNDCTSDSRSRSFDEGLNEIRLRAKDVVGNEAFFDVSFFIDSKDPRITRTEPRRGFASGYFEVQFKEENPVDLILHYGTLGNMRTDVLDIDGDCFLDRTKYYCSTNVDVEDFDGEILEYWFELTDIAGNVDDSKHNELEVDTTFPVVNDIQVDIDGSRVTLLLDITEINFDEAEYIDNDTSRPRWKRLCSRLKDGMCEKRITLREEGEHEIDIQIIDEAGNMISESVVVEIVDD